MKLPLHIIFIYLFAITFSWVHGQSQPELPRIQSDDHIINHTAYTLSYNQTYHVANWVAYELTASETKSKVTRTNKFVPDPLLTEGSASNEDYLNSGYDRGHLAPAADMSFSKETMLESFYLSNMAPQEPSFNRGIWSKLEKQVRQWAIQDSSVYIVTGTILHPGLSTIGNNHITIPQNFYKIVVVYRDTKSKGIAFLVPNEGSKEPLQHYVITIDSLEILTGRDFFYQLPDKDENELEHSVDFSEWRWSTGKDTSNSGKKEEEE